MPKRKGSRSPSRDQNMLPNYDEPDTSKGDYYCTLCDARMNCESMWQSHKIGKRHLTNLKKAPGEAPSRVKTVRVDDKPLIADELDAQCEPIVGLDFICETKRSDPSIDPFYNCYLCQATCTKLNIFEHLFSMKHRLAYLKKIDPQGAQVLEDFRLPKSQFEPMLRNVIDEKEEKHGRGKMEVKMEKSHGQVFGGRLKSKFSSALYRPFKSDYPDPRSSCNRLDLPPDHYELPSSLTAERYGSSLPPSMQRFKPGAPLSMQRYEPSSPPNRSERSYDSCKPSTSRYELPPNQSKDQIVTSHKVKSEKHISSSLEHSSSISSSKPCPPTPKSPTPEPKFEFDLEKHSKYLSPSQISAIINCVHEDLKENPESFHKSIEKRDLLLECFKRQFAAMMKSCYEKASPEKKKMIEFRLSKKGEEERNRKKLEALRIPGITKF